MSSLMTMAMLLIWLMQFGETSVALQLEASRNSAPKTTAQVLQGHNIGLTKQELSAALKNSDAEVRGLAAIALADEHSTDSVANITRALSAETVPVARADMALALTELGSIVGRISLQHQCEQAETPGDFRITAARYLLDSNDNSCLGSVISVLKSTTDSQEREQALELLPQFRDVSPILANRRHQAIAASLDDPVPAVRIAAADALGHLPGESSRAALQARLSREQVGQVRSEINYSLQMLKEKSTTPR